MDPLAKWLARNTPLRKPNCGEGIVSIKPRPKSAHDFLGLLYCFIVLLCICVVFCPYVICYPTVMVRYSLFVLKVPLNPKQTNKSTSVCPLNTAVWFSCIKTAAPRLLKSCRWLRESENAGKGQDVGEQSRGKWHVLSVLCEEYCLLVRVLLLLVTLHAKLSGAVCCYRSCLWQAGGVCGSVTTITRNCMHRSSPN